MIKIGYDAGHGLNTPGKRTPDGEREWTFNDKVARAFANELALYEGVASKRFDDPTGKRDVPLKERTDGANAWGADYYISFHHNANTAKWGNWTGVETFVYIGNKNTKSGKLAQAIHPAVVKAYGLKDRGIKEANYHILRETKMPAVLIEGGFMDSVIDIKKLRDDKVLENAGREIAQALAKFLGLKKRGEVLGVSKEELTMTQYEELKKLIDAQNTRIAELESQLGLKERAVSESHKEGWEWAKKSGIMNGQNPQRAVTREQLATVIYRLHNK